MTREDILECMTTAQREVLGMAKEFQEANLPDLQNTDGLITSLANLLIQVKANEQAERRIVPAVTGNPAGLKVVN